MLAAMPPALATHLKIWPATDSCMLQLPAQKQSPRLKAGKKLTSSFLRELKGVQGRAVLLKGAEGARTAEEGLR